MLQMVSALDENWVIPAKIKQNSCISIKAVVNTTEVKITTINYPNTTTATSNINMSQLTPFNFNATFCQTQQIGEYTLGAYDAQGQTYSKSWLVTKTGDDLTVAQSVLYIGLLVICFVFFAAFVALGFLLPGKNTQDEETKVIQISKLKYFKFLCFGLAQLVFTIILWIGWQLSEGFLYINLMAVILRMFFWVSLVALIIWMVLYPVFFFMKWWEDARIQKKIEQGFTGEFADE